MSILAAILAVAILPPSDFTGVVEDECSTLEFETYYDDEGREIFLQLLIWELTHEGEEIRAWRLWKSDQRPMRNADGSYTLIWNDGETTRRIVAKNFVESHRQRDTEMYRRGITPKELRRGLTKQFDHTPRRAWRTILIWK